MRIDVLTIFPEIIRPVLGASILGKAVERGLLDVGLHDFREWATDKHQKVDDKPYGGGPGMVLACQPVIDCLETVLGGPATGAGDDVELIMLTPQGEPLRQPLVRELATRRQLVMLCGRYEGFDERIIELLQPKLREVSIGDYVLTGGEPAAIVLIDAVSRLIPGVLGHDHSSEFESFDAETNLLDYPVYTRPLEFRGKRVPDVLLSGDHEAVARWRMEQARARTTHRRPDLLQDDAAGEAGRVDQMADVQRQPRGWRKDGERPERPEADDE